MTHAINFSCQVGRHDVDSEWMSQVRLNSTTQITPRFYFDQLSAQQITSKLLKKKSQRKRLFKMIVKECIQMGFDGIVLDLASIGKKSSHQEDIVFKTNSLTFFCKGFTHF